MKIAITGHADIEKANGKKRPAGMVYDEAVFRKVYEEIGMMMQTVSKNIGVGHDDMTLITGMARGVDEIFAHYAMAQDLSLIAAIPYRKKGGQIPWQCDRFRCLIKGETNCHIESNDPTQNEC